jgi:hypothetical protein
VRRESSYRRQSRTDHPQNGVAKIFNRTLIELTQAVLFRRNLPTFLWQRQFCRPRTYEIMQRRCEEAWSGKKPNMAHLREFGCDIWIQIEGDISKLSLKSEKHILVGFKDGPKVMRYYDATTGSLRNVVFSEAETQPKSVEIETSPRLEKEGGERGRCRSPSLWKIQTRPEKPQNRSKCRSQHPSHVIRGDY